MIKKTLPGVCLHLSLYSLSVCFNGLFVAAMLVDLNSQFVGLLEHIYSGDGTCTEQYTCMRQSHHISLHYHFSNWETCQ